MSRFRVALVSIILLILASPLAAAPGTFVYDGHLDANNLDLVITNLGSFGYKPGVGPGLEYPKGSGKTALYAAGLWIGARVNGASRVAVAQYTMEYGPGPMAGGTFTPDGPRFRNYKITRDDTSSPDYLGWPGDLGAPTDSLGQPALSGDAMFWSVYNDADQSQHTNLGGSSQPLGIEIRQSTFAFNRAGPLGNTIFLRYRLFNRGPNALDSVYVSLWADPDLGAFSDDLVGCDTTRSMAYCYNATNADAMYGSAPPALGLVLLQGVPTASDTLCMTSFSRFASGSYPITYDQTYHTLKGLKNDGSPMHVFDDPNMPVTRYPVPGDPVANMGWNDTNPGDRGMLLSTGPFSMAQGDSQEVVYALCIGQGTDRFSSVQALRGLVDALGGGCRFSSEIPTAISATLLDLEARPDRVRLVWAVSDAAGATAEVSRREEGSDWGDLGPATLEGSGGLSYEDRTVTAGRRYQYRLTLRQPSGEQALVDSWVEVPGVNAPAAAVLRVAAENPSSGEVRVSFGLPASGPVRLEVFDVHGRRVAVAASGFTAAGWHEARWNGPVASGVYFVRLETRDGVLLRKAVIAR